MLFTYQFLPSINNIASTSWNSIADDSYPFIRHEFLSALENSESACKKTGWQAFHLTVYEHDQLIAVMPLYLKDHSYGEYVFDWAWADAYHRNGISYYPKLLSAIPFTPATGQRLAIKHHSANEVTGFICDLLKKTCIEKNIESAHLLFPEKTVADNWQDKQWLKRRGVQFHWYNNNFCSFDDFLATFSSRKRKNLKKERNFVKQQGIDFKIYHGETIKDADWQRFYYFYQVTYAKRSGHGGYLSQDFFEDIAESMPNNLVLVMAYREGEAIAGALNFKDDTTLYGRYWGCLEEVEFLHFEACYYQGIEFCIANQLQRFDPGAQGEHKIQRGFTPTSTWSNHWLARPEFNDAIANFLQRENYVMDDYFNETTAQLPFKKSEN